VANHDTISDAITDSNPVAIPESNSDHSHLSNLLQEGRLL
jgi:hypothetical protein